MKLIKKEEVFKNINMDYGIDQEIQKILINGNAQFIIDLCRELKISYSVPSLAMHIANVFFYKKCYVNYDRFVILAGALLLAQKLKDVDSRLKHLAHAFYNKIIKISNTVQPYTETKSQLIKDEICIAQSEILRTLEYECDFTLPHQYVKKYCQMLIQDKQHRQKIFFTTRVLILDSYRTLACLSFTPLVVFISCMLIACRYESVNCHTSNVIRNLFKDKNPSEQQMYHKMLAFISQNQKIQVKAEDVRDCLIVLNDLIHLFSRNQMKNEDDIIQ